MRTMNFVSWGSQTLIGDLDDFFDIKDVQQLQSLSFLLKITSFFFNCACKTRQFCLINPLILGSK